MGIRNRYCCICERSTALKLKTKNHNCFLNWKKNATGMEADGIAEGFSKSIEMHGLKYNRLIGIIHFPYISICVKNYLYFRRW